MWDREAETPVRSPRRAPHGSPQHLQPCVRPAVGPGRVLSRARAEPRRERGRQCCVVPGTSAWCCGAWQVSAVWVSRPGQCWAERCGEPSKRPIQASAEPRFRTPCSLLEEWHLVAPFLSLGWTALGLLGWAGRGGRLTHLEVAVPVLQNDRHAWHSGGPSPVQRPGRWPGGRG